MSRNTLRAFEDLFIPEPNTGCWFWLGSITVYNGYGKYCGEGAHVYSYKKYKGATNKKEVHHTCKVKTCVNPDHLVLRTSAEHHKEHFPPCAHSEEHQRLYSGRMRCKECIRLRNIKWRKSNA